MNNDDEIMDLLVRLDYVLHHGKLGLKEDSLLERYQGFLNNSTYGKECTYARKCKHLFMTNDWADARGLILSLLELIKRENDSE